MTDERDTVRKQYHFWPGERGLDAWDVDRLIRLSAGLPVTSVPLDAIRDLDTAYWALPDSAHPTVRELVAHMRLVLDDLLEPEWTPGRTQNWGQWSPARGALVPGTLILVCRRP